MVNPNVRGPIRLPKPSNEDVSSPEAIRAYLDAVVRSIEQNVNNLYSNNNVPFVIDPQTTASRSTVSIAGNTASTTKVRDLLTTLIYVMKLNNRVN